MDLLQDSNVWFTFSFIIFAFIIYKYGLPAFNGMLDQRIEDIKKDLKEAESLRVEAQEMLAQYQRKHRDAVQEAEKILSTAKENAEQYKLQAEKELNDLMDRREAQLKDRLARMEQNAINDIQSHAADLAINAAKEIVIDKLDKKTGAKLVDSSISNVAVNIH